tara:strand:- start:504 stop:914 length:411 start_codon:yes stop_codon:yes gene_type:complete
MEFNNIAKELNNIELSRHGKKWSKEEEELLAKYVSDGKDNIEIAKELSRSFDAIESRIISHIIYPKYKTFNNREELFKKYKNIDSQRIEYYIDNGMTKQDKILNYLMIVNSKLDIIMENKSNESTIKKRKTKDVKN